MVGNDALAGIVGGSTGDYLFAGAVLVDAVESLDRGVVLSLPS